MYFFGGTFCLTCLLFLQSLPPAGTPYAPAPTPKYPDLYEASIQDLQNGLDNGEFNSVDLVKAYFARIDEVNWKGPQLRAIIETNPQALTQAAALDAERKKTGKRSPLHGIPILLKDNIATLASEGMNTTAGSFALLSSVVPGDATVAAKLRAAGAILLGKVNLSEWANIRGTFLPASGWSGRGGQATNPYYPGANPCGSSSGSGVAIAIGLAAGSLGTETDGSIVCPSSYNNLVGIKPTVGLTSRAGGKIQAVFNPDIVTSGYSWPNDKKQLHPDRTSQDPDYTKFLDINAIRGKRFGVPRAVFTDDSMTDNHPSINVEFNKSLDIIRSMGGIVVDPADLPSAHELPDSQEMTVLQVDLKIDLNKYLKSLKFIPTGTDTLGKIIEFNDAHKDLEQPKGYEGQTIFIEAEATSGYNPGYYDALRSNYELGRQRGIDGALKAHQLDALLLPTNGHASAPAALAGYPIVTVPLGFHPNDTAVKWVGPNTVFPAPGVPFGLSFLGTAYSEPSLIGFAYAYEQRTHTRLKRLAYKEAIPKTQLQDVNSLYAAVSTTIVKSALISRRPSADPLPVLSALRYAAFTGSVVASAYSTPKYPDLYEASILELQSGLERCQFSSVDLVKAYLARIDEVNLKGPQLRAVIEINPKALQQAASLDAERKRGKKRSPLHGIPILLKDNIATEGMNTTAGSYALFGSTPPGDATVTAKLREAGAIILGKANLSEWMHFRDFSIADGWSARGGQGTNPYYPGASPCGSSSGSAVATAIGLATGSLGTETVGSLICPASYNNVVAIKPTVGLTSRAGTIPISSELDTIGPLARSVADAAALLTVIAGRDNKDNYTQTAPKKIPNYTQFLNVAAIKGKRFGVPRGIFTDDAETGNNPAINVEFNKALDTIRSLGGIVVDPVELPYASSQDIISGNSALVLATNFKVVINNYLKSLKSIPTKVTSLAKLIAYNDEYKELEQPAGYAGQSVFVASESTSGYNSAYYDALRTNFALTREKGIDAVLKSNKLDAIVLPSDGLIITPVAIAGYPMISVPLGFHPDNTAAVPTSSGKTVYPAPGVPFGLSFIGTAYSEPSLIGFAYAYEQRTQNRLKRRAYTEAIPTTQLKDVIN